MRKFPHTYVIVFYILLISAILTWIIPGGEYVEEKVLVDSVEKTELVYREVENDPQSWQVFSALFKGFVKQSGIIVFILMIGGAFWIMNSSKAIDVGILSFIRFTGKLERFGWIRMLGADNIIIALVMIMFSYCWCLPLLRGSSIRFCRGHAESIHHRDCTRHSRIATFFRNGIQDSLLGTDQYGRDWICAMVCQKNKTPS
jgi:uncharacterized ion transporter superfamily protein YfcC